MMTRRPRTPALIVLLATVVLGLGYSFTLGNWGRAAAKPAGNLENLERLVLAGTEKPKAYFEIGQQLRQAKRFSTAAKAYRLFLAAEPQNQDALLYRATSLAQAGDANELYNHLVEMTQSNPKLAADILERPECLAHMKDTRFKELAGDAKAQAMD